MKKLPSWKELPIGGLILKPGSAEDYKTGGWRSLKPIHDEEKCVHCLNCWIFCPESCVIVEDTKVRGINYDFCKGCGICAYECPPKVAAISMVEERR